MQILTNVAGQCGGIEPLFDTIFSFLYRKTDYFHVMKAGDKIGFPQGRAQQLLLNSFVKFQQLSVETAKRAEAAAEAKKKPEKKPKAAPAPKAKDDAKDEIPTVKVDVAPPKQPAVDVCDAASASAAAGAKKASAAPIGPTDSGVSAAAAAGAKSASHLAEQVGVPYNGGRSGKYHWEQTITDVTIHAPVPAGTRARDVVCTISRSHLTLKLKGSSEPIVDADYPCDARNGQEVWERVKAGDSYWNLGEAHGEHCVSVYLEKERESWWKSAVHGHEEIDTTKVDSTKDMWDYDDETQGHIRKIMFDQHQKRLGKPTSDDMKNEDMLRKGWDAEGSPFKGTPFDPSKINMGGGGGGGPGMPPMPE